MTTIAEAPGHGISLGGLAFVKDGQPVDYDDGSFTLEVSADGTTWGNPEPVVASLISALSDGDRVTQTRVGNRQAEIHVRITGWDAGGLTAGEKALAAVTYRPAELVWQPPDWDAPPTVFDVVHSRMDFAFDDMAELRRERAYVLTIAALPWGRSATKVITPAVAAAPTSPTVVDSGSATTNWTTTFPTGATVSVVSGAVTSTYDPDVITDGTYFGTGLRRLATIDTSVNKYVGVDWKSSIPAAHYFRPAAENLPEIMRQPAPTAGFTRSWYRVAGSSVSEINFGVVHQSSSAPSATLSIDQVVQSDRIPAFGSTRQQLATIDPGGSVTAEGDVIVQHATAGLGQTIIYSHPAGSGYTPPLRPWLSLSNPVDADATTMSGARQSLTTTPSQYDVPVTALPKGDVHLWARVRLASGAAANVGIYYGVHSVMGGVTLDSDLTETRFDLPAAGGDWSLVMLARSVLPPRDLGPAGSVRIHLLRSTLHDIEIDEAWLFGMDEGRLTVVDCGTGTPAAGTVANRLKVTAPSLEEPNGAIRVATAVDFSDAYTPNDAKVLCDQTGHRFDPDGAGIFTAMSVTNAAVSLEHYPRWHSNTGTV